MASIRTNIFVFTALAGLLAAPLLARAQAVQVQPAPAPGISTNIIPPIPGNNAMPKQAPIAAPTLVSAPGPTVTEVLAQPVSTAPQPARVPATTTNPAVKDPCDAYKSYYEAYIVCQDRMAKIQRMIDARSQREQSAKATTAAAAPPGSVPSGTAPAPDTAATPPADAAAKK